RQARVGERYQGVVLRDLARARRQELLLDLGRRARAEKHWDEAADWLTRAAAAEFPVPDRLRVLARLANVWAAAGQPARAAAVWQGVLQDAELRSGCFEEETACRDAATVATERLRQLGQVPEVTPSRTDEG